MKKKVEDAVARTLVSKATVGSAAIALQEKADSNTHSIIDQTNAQLVEYYDELIKCVNENKSKVPGDFYVVVITKKEKLLENVIRNYFFSRVSCPTPDYDQAVYHYKASDETLSFVWVIPDRDTCLLLRANTSQVAAEELDLLGFVMNFANGELYKLAKKLNGESLESVILEK